MSEWCGAFVKCGVSGNNVRWNANHGTNRGNNHGGLERLVERNTIHSPSTNAEQCELHGIKRPTGGECRGVQRGVGKVNWGGGKRNAGKIKQLKAVVGRQGIRNGTGWSHLFQNRGGGAGNPCGRWWFWCSPAHARSVGGETQPSNRQMYQELNTNNNRFVLGVAVWWGRAGSASASGGGKVILPIAGLTTRKARVLCVVVAL